MAGHPGKRLSALLTILPLLLSASFRGAECGPLLPSPVTECESTMNRIAEKYVKLVLATGRHDDMYVDAYYGPEAWREEAARDSLPVETIKKEAASLLTELGRLEIPDGEGILGLPRIFFYAGARSVVTALWPIGDAAAEKMMASFYSFLAKGYSKAEALQRAKIEAIRSGSRDPYVWAGFVLNGEPDQSIAFR